VGFSARADAAADTVAGPITCVVLLVPERLSLGLEIMLKLAPAIAMQCESHRVAGGYAGTGAEDGAGAGADDSAGTDNGAGTDADISWHWRWRWRWQPGAGDGDGDGAGDGDGLALALAMAMAHCCAKSVAELMPERLSLGLEIALKLTPAIAKQRELH
jgi:hypothetical protein